MTILIPALEPDNRFLTLIKELKESPGLNIVVVDDGSGPGYHELFQQAEALGCTVLRHEKNMGKGSALKTGLSYIEYHTDEAEGVVTADSDGQHLPEDIVRVCCALKNKSNEIVLGVRKFIGKVPLKSAFGNWFSRKLFAMANGEEIRDTQTGLRGFPTELLNWLQSVKGEHFEYEMNMLLGAKKEGIALSQIDIETVYIADNKSTHFRPLHDSISIMLPFFKFCASGLAAALVDYAMLFLVNWLTDDLFLSVVVSRATSSGVNFSMNKFLVFGTGGGHRTGTELVQYYSLVVALMFINYLVLSFLSGTAHIQLFWSKVLTEIILFGISYTIQHKVIFKDKHPESKPVVRRKYS